MKRKLFLLITIFVLVLGSSACCFAASTTETQCADALYELGLFKGTGTNADGTPIYSLDKIPTRAEAITMLVRLLGKEDEAKIQTWETPFTDVPTWAESYVGYAYNNGLTKGVTSTTFGSDATASETQYLTFVLRALGYSDTNGDFKWDEAKQLTNKLGITYGDVDKDFLRGDIAAISYFALQAQLKDDKTTLVESLCNSGTVLEKAMTDYIKNAMTLQQFKKANVNPFESIPAETDAQKARYESMMSYWNKYGLSQDSKGLTLTWDNARALVGQDILVVKENVKTIADVLYYMCASGYYQYGYDLEYNDNGISWHFNRSPEVVFAENSGDCGGTAGFVAYLLEDDYDEVGTAYYSTYDGGHVVNYVRNNNEYYVVDVNQFAGGYNYGVAFTCGSDLKTAVYNAFMKYNSDEHQIKAMYAETGRFDGDSPIGWSLNRDAIQYKIKGYSDITVVYETPAEGYVVKEIDVSQSVLDGIEELRNTMWTTKDGSTREKGEYSVITGSTIKKLYVKIIGGGFDGSTMSDDGHGFGGGNSDWTLEVYYDDEMVTDYTITIIQGGEFGEIKKQPNGQILCTNQKSNGEIEFTITYKDSTLSLKRIISGL